MKENIVYKKNPDTGNYCDVMISVGFCKSDLKKLTDMVKFDTKTTVLFKLVCAMNKRSNEITGTYAQIAKKVGCKEHTTRNAITDLLKADVLRRLGQSRYKMNPDVFCYVDGSKRFLLACEYQRLPRYAADKK